MTNDLEHVRLQVDDDQRRAIDGALFSLKLAVFLALLLGVGVGYSL